MFGFPIGPDPPNLYNPRLRPEDNLNRSTLPLGGAESCAKSWRVTVTDPRGGRGTDYRVDDPSVDAQGGLLVIPTAVPTSQREWTQFLGRTARQDRRGQFCAVLCEADYSALSAKFGEESVPCDSRGPMLPHTRGSDRPSFAPCSPS